MREQAETLIALATDQGFAVLLASGITLRGWALATQTDGEEGLRQIEEGMAAYQATGMLIYQPYFLGLLAETYGKTGQTEAGLAVLAEAFDTLHKTGERWCEAEIYRLKGELLWQQVQGKRPQTKIALEAEACVQPALGIARQQHTKSLELRAALSLSRLWQHQGKCEEARQLLAEIAGWFTEGFDAADVAEARALLQELGV